VGTFSLLSTKDHSDIIYNRNFGGLSAQCHIELSVTLLMGLLIKVRPRSRKNIHNLIYNKEKLSFCIITHWELVISYQHLGPGYWAIFNFQGLLTPEDEIEEVTWYRQHVLEIFMWYILVINFMLQMLLFWNHNLYLITKFT